MRKFSLNNDHLTNKKNNSNLNLTAIEEQKKIIQSDEYDFLKEILLAQQTKGELQK